MTSPSRPAFRYHGSKWLLSPWIIAFFPAHNVYVEPFGGSAAVLLHKSRSNIEVYNDLDTEVVSFFQVLRQRPQELIRSIQLTPFAHFEWQLSFSPTMDPAEAARRFHCRSYMSIAGPTVQWNTGWRWQKVMSLTPSGAPAMRPASLTFMDVDHLYDVAERLRGVAFECSPALDIIRLYDSSETLFYCDPPYVFSFRGNWAGAAYVHEMSDDDHIELSNVLTHCEASIILSGYQCELYEDLYGGWYPYEREARINGQGSAVETVWLNPRAIDLLHHYDLPLFAAAPP